MTKGRAQEKIMHIVAKSVARWLAVLAACWPVASTPRVLTVPQGREDKEMTVAEMLGRLQGILDICEDIPKNLAITEQTMKDFLKEISVRNPLFYAFYKDNLKAVKAKMKELLTDAEA